MSKSKFISDMTPEERSAYFRAIRARVRKPTGFAAMSPEKVRAISQKGVAARNGKNSPASEDAASQEA